MASTIIQLQPVPAFLYKPMQRAGDLRFADLIHTHLQISDIRKGDYVLLGFPQDEGVRRVGGRLGAALGPNIIKRKLSELVAPKAFCEEKKRLIDLGNIYCNSDLEASQERVADLLQQIIKTNAFPILIGGGHETSYGHFLAYVRLKKRIGYCNVDAHFDLRPVDNADGRGSSGTLFRQMLEHKSLTLTNLACGPIQPARNPASLYDYAKLKSVSFLEYKAAETNLTQKLFTLFRKVLKKEAILSFDLDAVSQAEAPGVSSPTVCGLSAQNSLLLVTKLAIEKKLKGLDIVEYNPHYDVDERTARLAAMLIYTLMAQRK